MNPVISINTLAYEGYDLKTALQDLAKIGASHVELGYTRGWTEGLTEEHFSEASAVDINRLEIATPVKKNNLDNQTRFG